MRDLQNNRIIPDSRISEKALNHQVQETEVNWRSALTTALCKTDSSIKAERSWAKLCETMRCICPETNWLSICDDNFSLADEKAINSISKWLKALVISPDWSFPENVILMSTHDKSPHWKIIFSGKNIKLPYAIPPHNITVVPWRDKHSSGWKIIPVDSFNSTNAGEV